MMAQRRRLRAIHRVCEGVMFVEGPASNWVVLTGDGTVSLIDAGYPDDVDLVDATVYEAGQGAPLATIAITHGHSDHIGGINELVRRHPGVVVLGAEAELPNIRREVLHQVGMRQILRRFLESRVRGWTVEAVLAGGLRNVAVKSVVGFAPGATLRLSGHDVRSIPSAGHTPGHTAFRLDEEKVLVTGDALVTGHATTDRTGVQQLHDMFHHDVESAHETYLTLTQLACVGTTLPGHGPGIGAAFDRGVNREL